MHTEHKTPKRVKTGDAVFEKVQKAESKQKTVNPGFRTAEGRKT